MMIAESVYRQLSLQGVELKSSRNGLDFRVPQGIEVDGLLALATIYASDIQGLLKDHLSEAPSIKPNLPKPHLNQHGDLVIPFNSDRRYHWWAEGQSLTATLLELGVPEEVWVRYCYAPYPVEKMLGDEQAQGGDRNEK